LRGLSASGAWREIRSTAPSAVSTCASPGAARPNSRRAVPSGMTTEPRIEPWRRVPDISPMTAYKRSPMKTAGCWSTRSMPSRSAAFGPSTTTRSPRREWPASKNRPCASRARTARNSPGEAALIGSCTEEVPSGSLNGTELTSCPRTSTSASVPAARTPLRRFSRASESHGSTTPPAPPARADGLTTTSVADNASKRPVIWLPAVLESPSVATSAPTPITVPSTVSATRAGRAIRPAPASLRRSRRRSRRRGRSRRPLTGAPRSAARRSSGHAAARAQRPAPHGSP
jgi:hypothetical protein